MIQSPTEALGPERTVELPQGPIRIHERGSGPPLVFVHGLFSNAALWRKVVPLLSDDFRCVTADWPFGSHRSAMRPDADLTPTGLADTVADVLEALELTDVTLVGNDGGTMLCQLLVTRRPERVGRVVLTPGDAYENFPPPMFDHLCWLARVPGAIAALGQLLRIRPLRRLPNAYGWLAHHQPPPEVTDHYMAGLRDAGVRRDGIKFLRSVSDAWTLEAAEHFGAFDRPVLVAWAPEDRFFPLAHGERLARDFPHARLELVHGSRSYVAEDQPAELARLIHAFAADHHLTGSPA